MEFDPPADDGGAPVEEYVVEQRDPTTGQWVPVKTVPADKDDKDKKKKKKVKAKIDGLKEGDNVQFRVRAKNKGGLGEPSTPTDLHKVRPKKLKPRIDRNAMKAITLKSGKTHQFEIPVRGIPPPEYTWIVKDEEIKTDSQFSIDSKTPNVAKLDVLDAQRKRSGILKLIATNEWGKDEAELEYTVLGSPSKPAVKKDVKLVPADKAPRKGKGGPKDDKDGIDYPSLGKPAYPSKDYPSSDSDGGDGTGADKGKRKKKKPKSTTSPLAAQVSWAAPEDDGGVPIAKYVIEGKPDKSGKWEKMAEVGPNETQAILKDLKPDEKYKFRIRAVNQNDDVGEPAETSVVYVPPNIKPPEEAGKPEVVDFSEKHAVLKFKPPKENGGSPITHYIVEAKDKNMPSQGWKEVAVTKSPDPTAVVEGLKEGSTLQFRVRAVNEAGVGEPSEGSDAHLVRPKNCK